MIVGDFNMAAGNANFDTVSYITTDIDCVLYIKSSVDFVLNIAKRYA